MINIKKGLKEYDVNVNDFSDIVNNLDYIEDLALEYLEDYLIDELKISEEELDKIEMEFEIDDTIEKEVGDDEEEIDTILSKNDKCNISYNFNIEMEIDDNDFDTMKTLHEPNHYFFDKNNISGFFQKISEWVEECKKEIKKVIKEDDDFEIF